MNKKLNIYCRSFCKAIKEASDGESKDAVNKIILYGIRFLSRLDKPRTAQDAEQHYYLFSSVLRAIEFVSPLQFTQVFPIQKTYDGKRFESKDYFSTVQMIQEHGWNERICDAFDFLWDYDNMETRIFLVNYMSIADVIRRGQGQLGMMEEWAIENQIPLYRMHTDDNGKQFMTDENGRSFPVKKQRPKYLTLVKS